MKNRIHIRGDFFCLPKKKPRKYKKREHNNPPKGVRKMGNHLTGAFLFTKCTPPYIFSPKIPQYQGFLLFLHSPKTLFGVYLKNLPALWTSLTYLEKKRLYINRLTMNKANRFNKNAAVLKGIAAFFHSTKTYLLAFVSTNSYGYFLIATYTLRQSQAFLFIRKEDKPSFEQPRCRSPPSPFIFEPISKIERRV